MRLLKKAAMIGKLVVKVLAGKADAFNLRLSYPEQLTSSVVRSISRSDKGKTN